MPGRCSCAGSNCSCTVVGGANIVVTGTGNLATPYVVSLAPTAGQVTISPAGPLDLSEMNGTAAVLVTLMADVTDVYLPLEAAQIDIVFLQGGAGGHLVDWPTTIKWPGGDEPELTATPGAYDWIRLVHAGSVWVGQLTGSDLS